MATLTIEDIQQLVNEQMIIARREMEDEHMKRIERRDVNEKDQYS